jgi:hypothetical protein
MSDPARHVPALVRRGTALSANGSNLVRGGHDDERHRHEDDEGAQHEQRNASLIVEDEGALWWGGGAGPAPGRVPGQDADVRQLLPGLPGRVRFQSRS